MERPSHIIFDQTQSVSRRAPLFAMAIALQLAGFWLFTHGLATHLPPVFHPFDFVPVPDKDKPSLPPPPEPQMPRLKVPTVPPTDFRTAEPENNNGITVVTAQPSSNDPMAVKNAAVADRAAVGIASTHTVPPYPPIARRIGAEGKVTLRLTVSVEGRVTQAEIVTSSGREELDQTAQQWIVAHWTYRPAVENGSPVVSHVLATMTFSLASER
jgi:protein TonB